MKLRNLQTDQNNQRSLQETHQPSRSPRGNLFVDIPVADHKVHNEECESRNSHRYAVIVKDLATQWRQACPCKSKTQQETMRSTQKFLDSKASPTVMYTQNSLEFGQACEGIQWNHCTSTPHRSETNDISERAVRRVKEGASAILLQSSLDATW